MRKFTTYSECKISDKIEQLFVNIIISKNFNLIKFALDLGILNIINKFNPDFTWLRFNRIFAKHCLKIKESEIHQYSCDSESEIEKWFDIDSFEKYCSLKPYFKNCCELT